MFQIKMSCLFFSLFYITSIHCESNIKNKNPSYTIRDSKEIKGKNYEVEWNIFCSENSDSELARKIEDNIGPTSMPNSIIQAIFKEKNKIIRNTFYSIDQYGLRKSIEPHPELNKTNHLILAGDSQIFGEWCQDNETLPYNLSKEIPNYAIYNWGRRGGGPHNTLSQMQFFKMQDSIKQKSGIFIYSFYPYMYERIIGSKNYISWDHGLSPYYKIDNNGKLKKSGNFKQRSLISNFYRFLNSIPFLNYVINDFPPITKNDIKLIALIFKEMQNIYESNFPNGKFLVYVNNSFYNDETWKTEALLSELKQNNIPFEFLKFDIIYTKEQFIDGHLGVNNHAQQAKLYKNILNKYLN